MCVWWLVVIVLCIIVGDVVVWRRVLMMPSVSNMVSRLVSEEGREEECMIFIIKI